MTGARPWPLAFQEGKGRTNLFRNKKAAVSHTQYINTVLCLDGFPLN